MLFVEGYVLLAVSSWGVVTYIVYPLKFDGSLSVKCKACGRIYILQQKSLFASDISCCDVWCIVTLFCFLYVTTCFSQAPSKAFCVSEVIVGI